MAYEPEPTDPEVIRQQMEETRASLSEKLGTLEQQVVETVQGATTAVNETVGTVKEVVQETVDSVKESVHETVDTVKETFDLQIQMERHPWMMLGGAIALGYVGGRLLERLEAPPQPYPGPAFQPHVPQAAAEGNGGYRSPVAQAAAMREPAPEPERPAGPSWLGQLAQRFEPEIDQLKGLAIGAAMGLLRDMVVKQAHGEIGQRVAGLMDDFTTKLGGRPFSGPVAPNDEPPTSYQAGHGVSYPQGETSEMGGPVGATRR